MLYLNVYLQFFKTSLSRLVIYRKNFYVEVFVIVLWVAYYIISIEVVFLHTDAIRGWTRGEALLIVATLLFVEAFRSVLFYDNLRNLPKIVTEGDLDFILGKPVDAQFWVSLRQVNVSMANLFITGGILFAYALSKTDIEVGIMQGAAYGVLILCGALLVYALSFMLVTLSVWFNRIENVTELLDRIFEMGRYPSAIFKGALRVIVFTVIPLAVITNFPVEALRGTLTLANMLYAFGLTALFLFLARRFWVFAVSHYTSASS